jgi:hypothetical protein
MIKIEMLFFFFLSKWVKEWHLAWIFRQTSRVSCGLPHFAPAPFIVKQRHELP